MLAEYLVLYLKILRGSAREPTVAFLLVFYGIVLVLSFSLSHLLWFNAQAEKSLLLSCLLFYPPSYVSSVSRLSMIDGKVWNMQIF